MTVPRKEGQEGVKLRTARKHEELGWKAVESVRRPGDYNLAKQLGCYDLEIWQEGPTQWGARLTIRRKKGRSVIMHVSGLRTVMIAKRWLDHQMFWLEES